jgi:hypothetical protein
VIENGGPKLTCRLCEPLVLSAGCREAWLIRDGVVTEADLHRYNVEVVGGRFFTDWASFDHPDLGPVMIGGWHTKYWGQNPPNELLERELAVQVPWILHLARQSPLIEVDGPRIRDLGDDRFEVEVTVTVEPRQADRRDAVVAVNRASANIEGLERFGGLSRNHVTGPVSYDQAPPVGGDHSATWLNCGIYTEPVPDENAVHSLEHGAVWITYEPGLADSAVAAVEEFVISQSQSARQYILVSPYEGQSAPLVATAWGRQLELQSADDPRLREFTDTFVRGSQSPEAGALCTGGIGAPQR